jgi:hypothetical protein
MYVAVGVPENTPFNPQTRKEISKVEFHDLNNLPPKNWGVAPFLKQLNRWIRKRLNQRQSDGQLQGKVKGKKKKGAKHGGGEAAVFDQRNTATFGDTSAAGSWAVQDMFSANQKLTGRTFEYDGNPHNFGSSHPRYVNYNQSQSSGQSHEQQLESIKILKRQPSQTDDASVENTTVTSASGIKSPGRSSNEHDNMMAKIKSIIVFLDLPLSPADACNELNYSDVMNSVQHQRRMYKKVKESGGASIHEDKLVRIFESVEGEQLSQVSRAAELVTSLKLTNSLDSLIQPATLDCREMLREVELKMAEYDALVW